MPMMPPKAPITTESRNMTDARSVSENPLEAIAPMSHTMNMYKNPLIAPLSHPLLCAPPAAIMPLSAMPAAVAMVTMASAADSDTVVNDITAANTAKMATVSAMAAITPFAIDFALSAASEGAAFFVLEKTFIRFFSFTQ